MSGEAIPISALQHVVFCERQAALIHVDRVWREDRSTAEGRVLHERMDEPGADRRRGTRVYRAIHLSSEKYGLVGKADMVEMHEDTDSPSGCRAVPVEAKRGKRSERLADRVQLCAQALCLEEMMGIPVIEGALFYAATHKRVRVEIDFALRAHTEAAIQRMHEIINAGIIPAVARAPKCRQCSLEPECLPDVNSQRISSYLRSIIGLP